MPPPSLTVLRQSIYPDLARIDGSCRDCGVDSMLWDLSTDRHAAWQLQNGASMQPSDLLDFASASCFRYHLWIPFTRCILFYFENTICLRLVKMRLGWQKALPNSNLLSDVSNTCYIHPFSLTICIICPLLARTNQLHKPATSDSLNSDWNLISVPQSITELEFLSNWLRHKEINTTLLSQLLGQSSSL